MASVEPSNSVDVQAGVNPDSVQPDVRNFRLAPLRIREGTTPPDYTDNGEDVFVFGDSEDDADTVAILAGLPDAQRNGLKRAYTEAGSPALWAEPAPLSYDSAGTSEGTMGTPTAPAGPVDTVISMGVAASHLISVAADGIPLVVRPVILVVGALFESNQATLQGLITTTLDAGTPQVVTRDLWYAYGGSTSIVLPTFTVGQSGSLEVEIDLELRYRDVVADAFNIAVAAAQVIFQVIEYTSTETTP